MIMTNKHPNRTVQVSANRFFAAAAVAAVAAAFDRYL
jgi:hypothetical protein